VVYDGDLGWPKENLADVSPRRAGKGFRGVYATVNDEGTEWRSLVNGTFEAPELKGCIATSSPFRVCCKLN